MTALEAEALVQAVRVPRGELDLPQALQVGVGEQRLDHPHAEAAPAMLVDDERVRDPGEGRGVGDRPHEPGLGAAGRVEAERQ